MAEIQNADDWWDLVDSNWSHIMDIFDRCGAPLGDHWWSEGIGQEPIHHDEVMGSMLVRLRDERKGEELVRWFELCWIAAPDSPSIHSWRFWGDFCDLCSEAWVFAPEPEQATA